MNCESSKIYRHLYILFTLNTWFKIFIIKFLTGRGQIILFRYLQYFDLARLLFTSGSESWYCNKHKCQTHHRESGVGKIKEFIWLIFFNLGISKQRINSKISKASYCFHIALRNVSKFVIFRSLSYTVICNYLMNVFNMQMNFIPLYYMSVCRLCLLMNS